MNENNLFGQSLFGGLRIVESPLIGPVPKIQISPRFQWCTEEFRAEQNAWWLARFGTKQVAYMFNGNLRDIFVGPGSMEAIKRAVKLENFT